MNEKLFTSVESSIQLLGELGGELKNHTKAKVESTLRDMDLVSREEHEITALMLERALARITELEQKIDQLTQHKDSTTK